MAEYIDREKLMRDIEKYHVSDGKFQHWVEIQPAADVVPVVHGRWELTAHSFYRDTFDESCELCVYIVANCSECSGKHPNSYQVYSKTLYAPEDADNNFRFNQKVEEEKALLEFKQRKVEYANYCPNCGADMRESKEE